MEPNTLDDLGRSVLEAVGDRHVTLETLSVVVDAPRSAVETRVSQLVDNALVREVDEGYERTENGRRVLEATGSGADDDRIDAPDRIERAIEAFSLRADEADAVRGAFAFLRHWGEASTAELVDGVYSEVPAGYDTPEAWWGGCVGDRLEALPVVRFDPDASPTGRWRWEGESSEREDGRAVADPPSAPRAPESVRNAFESRDLNERERTVARLAFEVLYERVTVTDDELVESAVGSVEGRTGTEGDRPTGTESTGEWADRLSEWFADAPGIDRVRDADERPVWRYDGRPAGPNGR